MYSLRSLFFTRPLSFCLTSSALMKIFALLLILSGTSNKNSFNNLLITVCNLRAPMFSISALMVNAVFAISSMASSVNSMLTSSASKSAMYCLVKAFRGSLKILMKSSFVRLSNSTRIGNRPCNSGIRSEGLEM